MIRATQLAGRAVVDIDAAEKIGTIDKIILDPDGKRLAGFSVTRGGSGYGGAKTQALVPSESVHAIGPDAVTIRQSAVAGSDTGRLETLPRGSDIIGRKVVSEDGRFLGKVSDVLIEPADGRIVGYLLSDHQPGARFAELFAKDSGRRRRTPYLPADARIRTGRELIVASEDAVSYDWTDGDAVNGTAPAAATTDWANDREDAAHPGARTIRSDTERDEAGAETNPRVR